jgi:hypothetical protein
MNVLLPFGIACLAFVIRLPFLAHGPAGWDDVDFALGVDNYDLSLMQPHFPGYPVYMLIAIGFARLIANPFLALSLLSALANACTVFPLYSIVKRCSRQRTAVWVAVLWAVNPLGMVLGTQPLSDSFGNLLAVWLVAASLVVVDPGLAEKKRALVLVFSGILLGLLYGVRISYLPLGAVFAWALYVYGRDTRRYGDVVSAIVSSLLVNLLWLYGLVLNVGSLTGFWRLAAAFTEGHFSDWGGAYTGSHAGERLLYWIGRQWFAAGLGAPWNEQNSWFSYLILVLVCAGITGGGIAAGKTRWLQTGNKEHIVLLFLWIVPYLLWAFFAQNVEKPRHILPLMIPLIWGIVWGLQQWRRFSPILLTALAASTAAVGVIQVREQPVTDSPMAQLAHYVAQADRGESSIIYTYEEERVIRYLYPSVTTVRLRKWSDFQASILAYSVLPDHVYLTDRVLDGFHNEQLKEYVKEAARFRGSEWLYPTYHDIVLYEVRQDKRQEWIRLIKTGQQPAGS